MIENWNLGIAKVQVGLDVGSEDDVMLNTELFSLSVHFTSSFSINIMLHNSNKMK